MSMTLDRARKELKDMIKAGWRPEDAANEVTISYVLTTAEQKSIWRSADAWAPRVSLTPDTVLHSK